MPEENAPNFNVARATIPITPDGTAVEAWLASMDQKTEDLAGKLRAVFDLRDAFDELDRRFDAVIKKADDLKLKVESIALPAVNREAERDVSSQHAVNRPSPLQLAAEQMSQVKDEERYRELFDILTEIRDAIRQRDERGE